MDLSWKALIHEHPATPELLIAVDKARQQLAVFERRSPLRLTRNFICTTGQMPGDKETEGDLKTPEGIYFVVQRIGSGLEYLKYGTEAYTLNYPNPMDRLRGKTGYGIWIHGRGEPLAPLQTQGCVSLNNEDLAAMGTQLSPGTPVALTGSFLHVVDSGGSDLATVQALEKKVYAWAKAWGQRSRTMFDFYDKEAYSLAQGEPFSRFQGQKERLFRFLPWIKNNIRDVRVLQGPGYWVTWFYQDYQAPNLTTSGVRRLYWGQNAEGEFKILGMEWAPGMTTGTLLASADPALPPIEAQPRTEGQQPAPAAPSEIVQPDLPESSSALVSTLPESGEVSAPPSVKPVPQPSVQEPGASPKEHGPFADHVEDPAYGKMAEPPNAAQMIAALQTKNPEPEKRSGVPAVSPLNLPPALPSQGLAVSTASVSTGEGALLLASAPRPGVSPKFGPVVSQTLPENRVSNPVPQEAPLPEIDEPLSGSVQPSQAKRETYDTVPPPEDNPEEIKIAIAEQIEVWRDAWEAGNLDAYAACYAPKARQGSRFGVQSIVTHKRTLWKNTTPVRVVLQLQTIEAGASEATVVMKQEYVDSSGNGDTGMKRLTLKKSGGRWLVTQEIWSPLPDEANN